MSEPRWSIIVRRMDDERIVEVEKVVARGTLISSPTIVAAIVLSGVVEINRGAGKKFEIPIVASEAQPPDRLALAKVGIEALVDEATGYQKDRPKDALKKRLRHHLKKP